MPLLFAYWQCEIFSVNMSADRSISFPESIFFAHTETIVFEIQFPD